MIAEERRKKIVELIHNLGVVDLKYLSTCFDVSIYTIRRDLNILEQQGIIDKTRGGAKKNYQSSFIPELETGMQKNIIEKTKIAEAAAGYIQNGDTIMLMGTTINQLLLPYLQHKNILIVTNSILIAEKTLTFPNLEVIILGGKIKSHRGNILDITSLSSLRTFYFDKCFLGAAGIHSEKGITTAGLDSATFTKAVIDCSKESFVLADYSKFGNVTFSKIADVCNVNFIITNDTANKNEIERCIKKGAQIQLV